MVRRRSTAVVAALRLLKRLFFSCLALCAGAAFASADEPVWSLDGFGTLGATRTSSKEVEFVRDLSQPRGAKTGWDPRVDSLLGLQARWRIVDGLEAVAQGVSRYRYDDSFRPELTWAFLRYEPAPWLSLRAGRVGTEFFMLADSRLVGYSYLTVRPPGDYFWYLPFSSIDGGDITVSLPAGEAVLRAKGYYGISDQSLPLADRQWKIDGSPMVGGYLEWSYEAWQIRASYANIRFHNDLPIHAGLAAMLPPSLAGATAEALGVAGKRSDYWALGLIYDHGPWQAQVMLNHIEHRSRAFQDSNGGYALLGYRIGQVTPYAGYSWVDSRSRRGANNPAEAAVMADGHAVQKTSMLGVRWDIYRNTALKGQWDRIQGQPTSIFPYRRESAAWDGRMDVFSVTLDFVF